MNLLACIPPQPLARLRALCHGTHRVYGALARIEDDFAAEVGQRRFRTFKTVMAELAAGRR